MDFYKKVLDSMDRVSDSNERLAEYLDGVLNAKGLESFVSVTPHKDGYRMQIAGKYSPLYADVYLDGEDLVLGGSQIGKLGADVVKELATFLGIPEKEVGEKADRFASVIRYLIAHNHRPVDELAKVKDDGESDEVAEKVEEVFADFAANTPGDPGVRHIDLVVYGTPVSLLFRTSDKNKDRLDVYAAVDGDVDVEAERQYVGSDSIANKGRAVVKALMGGIMADLAGKAAVKEAEAEKKAAVEAGAFDADVLYAKIKEMHEDLQNLPAGAKQEIMAEFENDDHEVKLMFTPGEAEGSVAFIMDVDGKPHEIGEYLISNKMLPYFAVSDLLRVADKVLGIEIADSVVSDEAKINEALKLVRASLEANGKPAKRDISLNIDGVPATYSVKAYKDGDDKKISVEVIYGKSGERRGLDYGWDAKAGHIYGDIVDIIKGSGAKKMDDEHAAPESALVPLSDAVNAMRNDRSIKTKVANVDYLGSNVSFILTRKVDKDKGLVHVYVRNGKDAPMKFVASYDLDGIGIADRMFHAGLKELGIEDACNKKVKDDDNATLKSAQQLLSFVVNNMRADRSAKSKIANVGPLSPSVSFILTRNVGKDNGLVTAYIQNGKDAQMQSIGSYDLNDAGVADQIFHAGLKELGIGGAPRGDAGLAASYNKKAKDGVAYEVEDMDRLREAVGDTFVLEELIKWEDDEDINAFIRDLSRTVFGDAAEIEDSKDKNPVCDGTARNRERMQSRVASALAGENGGRAYAMRSYGKDKTLASVAIKVTKDGDKATGVDVAYIYTTPTIDIVVDEHYDIPAGDAPEKELGAAIDARFDELGKIAVDAYEGKITEDEAKELIGGNVEIEHDIVPSSVNMVRDAVASSPEEVETRVKSVIAEGHTGRAFVSRVYGGDVLGKAVIKAVKSRKPGYDKGVEVTFSFSTPELDVSSVEYFDIPEAEYPYKVLGKQISDRMDEIGRAVLHYYDGIIELSDLKAIPGGASLKIEKVTDSADPKEAELIASLEADGSDENVARVAKEWADIFGFKTMKGSDGKELMAFSYVNGESDEKPTQYSYKQRAWTRIA